MHVLLYIIFILGILVHPWSTLGGAGPNWEKFQSAQVPSQLAPRSLELNAGPNWEQLVQLASGWPLVHFDMVFLDV